MIMKKVLASVVVVVSLISGCTSVPMEPIEKSELAKQYNSPSEGMAGLYVYRAGSEVVK